ncbi:hypothetical protein F4782DRAFT_519247 [Xylaria castorea]|nr:hypothetical protein F4782DRAFT_519247 [Xylaria castorea]
MDASELRLAAGEDGLMANTLSQPVLQPFGNSLFLSEQFGSESPAEWNGQISPDVMDYWLDFDDGTSEHTNPFETNMDLLIDDHNVTGNPASKPRRVLIDDRQKAVLTEWIANNPEPYPSKEDKMSLAFSTGLTLNQTSSWFTRTRQRRLNRVHVTGTSVSIVTPEKFWSPSTHTSESLGVFEGFWPSSASLPGHLGGRPMRNPSSESRSLPPFFTLDFIGPYTSAPSRSSHDNPSLEALVSTRRSAASRGGNQERRKRLAILYGDHNHHRCIEVTTKLDFIKIWIADVAQHTFYPSEGDSILTRAGPDAASADSANDDHGYVIGENRNSKESLIPEDPEYNNSDRHAISDREVRRMKNRLAQQAHRRKLKEIRRQKQRHFEETRMSSAGSNAGSSAGSAASASSYMSFGPRKGRRVAFQGTQDTLQLTKDASPATASFILESDECMSHDDIVLQGREAGKLSSDEGGQIRPTRTVIYPCTFCRKEFSNSYVWKRHEVSAHAPQFQWVCGLDMPANPRDRTICPICAIAAQRGTDSVACTHRLDECWEKPTSQRAFFRRDAFKQHIRVFHCKGDSKLLSGDGINLDEWMEEIDTGKYDLTCHFCGFTCETWGKRASHLIEHFNDKIPLNLWIPHGPYALTPDGSVNYQLPMSDIANYEVCWRCPFNDLDLSSTLAISTRSDSVWECSLCGSEINLCSERILWHLLLAHDPITMQSRLIPPVFSRADEFIEHLVKHHIAKRGDWMTGLLLTALQRKPRTDEL